MSEPDENTPRPTPPADDPATGAAPNDDPRQAVTGPMPTPAPQPEDPTVGTGSTIAIGCVAAMLLVLAVGILIMLWLR